jgi:hypothetical protein
MAVFWNDLMLQVNLQRVERDLGRILARSTSGQGLGLTGQVAP